VQENLATSCGGVLKQPGGKFLLPKIAIRQKQNDDIRVDNDSLHDFFSPLRDRAFLISPGMDPFPTWIIPRRRRKAELAARSRTASFSISQSNTSPADIASFRRTIMGMVICPLLVTVDLIMFTPYKIIT
jgi:hypothetical protein